MIHSTDVDKYIYVEFPVIPYHIPLGQGIANTNLYLYDIHQWRFIRLLIPKSQSCDLMQILNVTYDK